MRLPRATPATVCVVGFLFAVRSLSQTVQFSQAASQAAESETEVNIGVSVSPAPTGIVTVKYAVTQSQARDHEHGAAKDYEPLGGGLSFGPGETSKNITIDINDDTFFEGDERITIELADPSGATLGAQKTHVFTIVDDDRPNLKNVKTDYGAAGNGTTDDRAAIQAGVDWLAGHGGGVLVFPAGDYLVGDHVVLKQGVTMFGYGATTRRLPNQGKWENTFRQENYFSDVNSKPFLVQGFTMDGNSQNQCADPPACYQDFSLQQAHLLLFLGNYNGWDNPGRVQAFVEDVTLQNGVGDGLSIVSNIDVKACHIKCENVFRGGFTMTGGGSKAWVYDLTTSGDIDPTGIDVEIEGSGTAQVHLEKIRLLDGDFDISLTKSGLAEEGVVEGKDIKSVGGGGFHMSVRKAKVRISDSEFWIGPVNHNVGNLFLQGYDYQFDNCTFVVTEPATTHHTSNFIAEADRGINAIDVLWNNDFNPTLTGERMVLNNCTFLVDEKTVEASDTVCAVHTRWNDASQDNKVILNCCTVDKAYDAAFHKDCKQCVHNEDSCSSATFLPPAVSAGPVAGAMRPAVEACVIALNGRIVRSVTSPKIDRAVLTRGLPAGVYVLRFAGAQAGWSEVAAVGIGR